MKRFILGFAAAAFVHLVILLFGGIFFLGAGDDANKLSVRDVDVVDSVDEKKDEKKPEQELEKRKADEVAEEQDKPPDMRQLVEIEREPSLADATPELQAMSLSALESALSGGADGTASEFGSVMSLASGGRIGGTGSAEGDDADGTRDLGFGLGELDQTARPVFQSPPSYPADLRQRKVEGVVTVLFVVDSDGHVLEPKVERSTDPAFDAPALEAVRQWKFEPAVRNGKKVPSKLRIPIRFSLNS